MTNKQRAKIYRKAAEIYRKAAEIIFNQESSYCCEAIVFAMGDLHIYYGSLLAQDEDFEQFFIFKSEGHGGVRLWWESDDTDSRIIALLFAEQMALNP